MRPTNNTTKESKRAEANKIELNQHTPTDTAPPPPKSYEGGNPPSKNRASALPTSSACVIVISCPPPSTVNSRAAGTRSRTRFAVRYGTTASAVPYASRQHTLKCTRGRTYPDEEDVRVGALAERCVGGREAPHGAVPEGGGDGGVEPGEVRGLDAHELRDGVIARVAVRQVPNIHLYPNQHRRTEVGARGRRTRTGQLAVQSCMIGEERKRVVRERSVGSRSPVGATRATLSCTSCGNCALNAAATPPPCATGDTRSA